MNFHELKKEQEILTDTDTSEQTKFLKPKFKK